MATSGLKLKKMELAKKYFFFLNMVNIGNNFWLQIGYISLQTEIMLVDHSKLSNDHSKLKIDHSKVHIVL